jgi:hypothetical protein
MNKSKLNFIIDATMFLCLMGMVGLGFMMKYTMPPGERLREVSGTNPYMTWLGWDRHDWGDIHFYLAIAFLTLLVFHTILHWKQIVGLFQRLIPDPKLRFRIALIFLLVSLLLVYFPFMITPETQPRGRGLGGGGGRHRSQLVVPGSQVVAKVQPGPAASP